MCSIRRVMVVCLSGVWVGVVKRGWWGFVAHPRTVGCVGCWCGVS